MQALAVGSAEKGRSEKLSTGSQSRQWGQGSGLLRCGSGSVCPVRFLSVFLCVSSLDRSQHTCKAGRPEPPFSSAR